MERLTEEKQIGPFASLKDKAEAKVGAFADYDCLYAHMVAVTKLKKYEDTGLEPEEINRIVDAYGRGHTLRSEHSARIEIIREISTDRLRELAQAEKDGRLVVLPCGPGAELTRNGETFKADHWNVTLSAFREEPRNASGRQVALFSIEDAKKALEGSEEASL